MTDLTNVPGDRPLILLDIDGVLNIKQDVPGPGHTGHLLLAEGRGAYVTVRDDLPRLLERLALAGDLMWASGWNDGAPLLFANLVPWLGSLPHLTFPQTRNVEKLPVVVEHVADRAVVWIDDLIPQLAWEWADQRAPSTLLVPIDPEVGLTENEVDVIERWVFERTAGS